MNMIMIMIMINMRPPGAVDREFVYIVWFPCWRKTKEDEGWLFLINTRWCHKIGRTMGQFRKAWVRILSNWKFFGAFFAHISDKRNVFHAHTPASFSNQHFCRFFAVQNSSNFWSNSPRVQHFLSSALWMTELSATSSCLEELWFFRFLVLTILWDTAVIGAHLPHMSVETARPGAGVPLTTTKK